MTFDIAVAVIATARTLEKQRHQVGCGCRGILTTITRVADPDPAALQACPWCGTPVRRVIVLVKDGGTQALPDEQWQAVVAADLEQGGGNATATSVFVEAYEMVMDAAVRISAEEAISQAAAALALEALIALRKEAA